MKYFVLLAIGILLFSCQKEDKTEKSSQYQEITLVYMIADNDLSSYAIKDINEMERAFVPNERDKWLVYIDTYATKELPHHPVLLEIVSDQSDEIKSKIVYSYPEQNSADKHIFRTILNDAFSVYGGVNKPKGLILWSHANAWLPNDYPIENDRKTAKEITETPLFKSFGRDDVPKTSVMEITELAESLQPYHFDYILFDACFMASVEVLYELRHSADFFIASPAEILADGFPYQQIVPQLNSLQLEEVIENYYNYYTSQKGVYQSATITLIESKFLDELAMLCKKIIFETEEKITLQISDLQQYSRNDEKWLFDLKQLLLKQENYLSEIENCWKRLCKAEKHTSKMAHLPLDNCNGISTYLFNQNTSLNEIYRQISWYKNTNLASFFTY